MDAAAGDYRLLPGSPLIDAGDPATPQGLDLDGNPLVVDGNGDGNARRDLGAFEFRPAAATRRAGIGRPAAAAPTPSARSIGGFRATPSVFAVARAANAGRGAPSARDPLPLHAQRGGAGDADDPATAGRRPARYRTVGTLSAPAQGREPDQVHAAGSASEPCGRAATAP